MRQNGRKYTRGCGENVENGSNSGWGEGDKASAIYDSNTQTIGSGSR